jgi:hypothetical protein
MFQNHTMRKLILILIHILFINAAFSQSYIEPLNQLNSFLQAGRDFYIKNIEVKDGYLYIYESIRTEYQKVTLKDLGIAIDNKSSAINASCLNNAKCVYQSSTKYISNYLHFYVPNAAQRSQLVILLNNFIISYADAMGYPKPQTTRCMQGDCENGTGIYVYADSSQYEGEWKNGQRTGKGTVTKVDGTEVLGKWENDALKDGKGTIKYPNKYVYEGEIKDNLASGDGTLSFKDDYTKAEYKGTFVNGLLNGKGKYYGLLKDTKYERTKETYTGDFKDGLYHGYGVYEITSHFPKALVKGMDTKATYEGEWKKGKKDGFGIYFFNGTKYEERDEYTGRWKNDKKYDVINDSVYSQKDKAIFRKRIDSLKDEITKVDNLLIANYQHDIDLAKQKKYGELLGGKKWIGEKSFLQPITYDFGEGGITRKITAEFEMRQEIEFVTYGDHIDVKITENPTLPRSKKLTDGGFVLIDKYGSNHFGDIEYYSPTFVTSSYTTSTMNFNWPEFKLSYAAYSSNYADVNKMPIYTNDKDCRYFVDKYMIYLTKCNFKAYLKEGKIVLRGTDNTGAQIDFEYLLTPIQMEFKNRKDNLEEQIRALEKLIANKD